MFFSPTYLMYMLPAFILMAFTSWYVNSAYKKWSRVQAQSGLTGAQAAQRLISTRRDVWQCRSRVWLEI